jgi:hypothetical protein
MVKVIAFLKCKQGLSRADFIDYYENKHVPLIRSIAPQILDYRRNFLIGEDLLHDSGDPILGSGAAALDFDVVTEITYADEAAFAAAMSAFTSPVHFAAIVADEENLFDRSKHRFYRVDERCSV